MPKECIEYQTNNHILAILLGDSGLDKNINIYLHQTYIRHIFGRYIKHNTSSIMYNTSLKNIYSNLFFKFSSKHIKYNQINNIHFILDVHKMSLFSTFWSTVHFLTCLPKLWRPHCMRLHMLIGSPSLLFSKDHMPDESKDPQKGQMITRSRRWKEVTFLSTILQ